MSADTGSFEGWWSSTPASADGGELPFEQWPSEFRKSLATAQINTWNNTLVEAYDRTGCVDLDAFIVNPSPSWPKQSIVIIDVKTGELLDSFPIAEDGTAPK